MSDPLVDLVVWVTDVIGTFGYAGVAVLVALEVIFPPIPSEVILPLAGFLAGQGRLSFLGVVAAATIGSVLGGLPLYALGYWLGARRLRVAVRRYGRFFFVNEPELDRAQAWFDRHGAKAVLIGRVVPLVRSLVSVPAGLAHMPLGAFVLYTALGSFIWNAILVGFGWVLGDQWDLVRQYTRLYAQTFQIVAVIALLGAGLWGLTRRVSRASPTRQDG